MGKGYVFCVLFSTILIYHGHILCDDRETNPIGIRRLFRILLYRQTEEFKEILSRYPYLVNSTNRHGFSLLQAASHHAYREGVDILLALGADVNFQHALTGDTALHRARDSQIVQMLVDDPKIDLEILNKSDLTPLQVWFRSGYVNYESVHILLEAGANANQPRPESLARPLHLLFFDWEDPLRQQQMNEVQLQVARDLVAHGADVNARMKNGLTPLHFAAQVNNPLAVRFLIEKGADRDAIENNYHRTPSAYALYYDALDALQVLSEFNADWHIVNIYGSSVVSILEGKAVYTPQHRVILNQYLHREENGTQKWKASYDPYTEDNEGALSLKREYCRTATMARKQRRKSHIRSGNRRRI